MRWAPVVVAALVVAPVVGSAHAGATVTRRCAFANRLVEQSLTLPARIRAESGTRTLNYADVYVCAGKWIPGSAGRESVFYDFITNDWLITAAPHGSAARQEAFNWQFHVSYTAYTSIVPHRYIDYDGYYVLGERACLTAHYAVERMAWKNALTLIRSATGVPTVERDETVMLIRRVLSKTSGLKDGIVRSDFCV